MRSYKHAFSVNLVTPRLFVPRNTTNSMLVVSWASWDTIVSRDAATGVPVAIAPRTEDELDMDERRVLERSTQDVSTNTSAC